MTPVPSRLRRRRLTAAMLPLTAALGLHSGGALAQTSGRIVPTFSMTETVTDNARLDASVKRWESVTTVSPGLRYASRSGRVLGTVDYSLNGIVHARESERSSIQHALRAALSAEVVENFFVVETSANISQQSVSAFGQPTYDPTLDTSNRTEVRTLSVTPTLRGRLFGDVSYTARLGWATTTTSTAAASASTSLTGGVSLAPIRRSSPLGWTLDLTRSQSEFGSGRRSTSERASLGLSYRVSPELDLTLRGGYESTDLAGAGSTGTNNWGWGAVWTPTERTKVSASQDRRFFGNGYAVNLSHRMRRAVFTYSDVRDVSTDAGPGASALARTQYDLLYTQFASIEPDPTRRQQLVDDYIRANGLNGNALAGAGFLSSSATVQRRQSLAMSMTGQRTSLFLSANRTEGRRVDASATVVDDFANGNVVATRGLSANVSHRLTPQSSATLIWSTTQTDGSTGGQGTELNSLSGTWSTQLGRRLGLAVTLRHVEFDSPIRPYTENAVTANLSVRF